MDKQVDRDHFLSLLKNRAVVLAALPAGPARDLATSVNGADGVGDGALATRAEYAALFDLLVSRFGPAPGPGHAPAAGELTLVDDGGQATAVGRIVEDYVESSIGRDQFFDEAMYMVHVTGWPPDALRPEQPVDAPEGAVLALWPTDPADTRHIAAPGERGVLFETSHFSMVNSGNRTLRAPKRSWKVDFEADSGDERLVGMARINLKSMVNDPSQMREALAWRLFGAVGVPAARHSYAKFAIDGSYLGLFSLIEQVDKGFLREHFGHNDAGNLYKAYCGNIGCATLEYRRGADGDDGGRQYFEPGNDDLTYRLKTNEADPVADTYDDLARFVRMINGIGIAGGDERFATDAYRAAVEDVMNARAFLRWAGVNLLLGSWDNYFATPANYYLYNSGKRNAAESFMDAPYFTFVPWDYDNSFGIDYFGTRWQYTDIVDWAANTKEYCRAVGAGHETSRIPLVQNLLRNHDFCQYYLDHLEHLLDSGFDADTIDAQMRGGNAGALWGRVSQAAYLESDTPEGAPFTGRQFTNDEVYRCAHEQFELDRAQSKVEGIVHFVRMRVDSARERLATLRTTYPKGASGATFSEMMEVLPERG